MPHFFETVNIGYSQDIFSSHFEQIFKSCFKALSFKHVLFQLIKNIAIISELNPFFEFQSFFQLIIQLHVPITHNLLNSWLVHFLFLQKLDIVKCSFSIGNDLN